jgi:hypothetical protein
MVSRIIIIALLCGFLGGCWNNYFPEKGVRYKDMKITWYWRSIGDNRRDFVEVSKGFKSEIVLSCTGMQITDIKLVKNSLVIRSCGPILNDIYESRSSGLGIPVRVDSTATEAEYDKFFNRKFYEKKVSNRK